MRAKILKRQFKMAAIIVVDGQLSGFLLQSNFAGLVFHWKVPSAGLENVAGQIFVFRQFRKMFVDIAGVNTDAHPAFV